MRAMSRWLDSNNCNQATVSTLYKSERIHLAARWTSYKGNLLHIKNVFLYSLYMLPKKPAVALRAMAGPNYAIQPSCTTCAGCHELNVTAGYLSQRRDSNPRISVLQTDALNHLATLTKNKKPRTNCPGLAAISINFLYHNIFPRHVHTSCFWQPCE